MDFDDFQQNLNTRVVFREPRGMIRWLQLFFAILATATVIDFSTRVAIDITCPPPQPSPAPPTPAPQPAPQPNPTPVPLRSTPTLTIGYPFDFSQQVVNNTCTVPPIPYQHMSSLSGSPQFFVMTAVLSILYASTSLVVYLCFSSTYDSLPIVPMADLLTTAILCLFWFIASSSFSSGVSLLKSTATYDNLAQTLCPATFKGQCVPVDENEPSWKSLNVALISGFTSFFLWGSGLWFVYKETHFHTPRDQFGTR